ncbi:DNA replication/repair protein RecF [Lysobacter sp. A3-1-A15]|uniref:DNA replication/repair protein RecF n=1 Tax=Novilysobacter viscosus TaxID=3098602 RepID=UPI002ED784AD
MRVLRLQARQLRRFDTVEIEPASGLNLILGGNGAGKTSLLEALHLMAYGRSFRGRVRDGLIRSGETALEVFVEWEDEPPTPDQQQDGARKLRRAGLRHTGSDWTGRLDGRDVTQLGDLCAALAVVTFEPGSHALITGSGEHRRRFLDWGLFHVEHGFLPAWRRYARAHKQRNALLKRRGGADELGAWEREMADAGDLVTRHREVYLASLQAHIQPLLREWAPALGAIELSYQPGWRRDATSLDDALLLARERDMAAGHTSVGPHRADWRVDFDSLPGREALSRGQAKLTALAAILGQGEHQAVQRRQWPVVALDDLASELDRAHQRRVLERLDDWKAQVLITGTDAPAGLGEAGRMAAVFHVEHGVPRRA